MSGIGGICYLDERIVDQMDLEKMSRVMSHRGPDATGSWCEKQAGLIHLMLGTTPESAHEKFPLLGQSGNLVLTADGRIDNRDELLGVFDGLNGRDVPPGDGHLILAAYEKWGERAVEHLIGAFSFAIWDRRRQVLFCARDHFGVKPFYYYYNPNRGFFFASEIKALLCQAGVPCRLNETRLADYLLDFTEDKTDTFYKDIYRLAPSSTLTLDRSGLSVRHYWEPDPSRKIRLKSDVEYAEAFRDVFAKAVRSHMRSNGPIGISLSGGLDSCSIACMARKLIKDNGGGRLHSFSLLYRSAPGGDEGSYIRSVVKQGGIEAHFIDGDSISPLANLETISHHFDEPLDNPHFPLGWALWDAARKQGVRVLLDGVDGDVTVSYYFIYLTELARKGRLLTLAREAVGLSRNFYLEEVSPLSIMWRRGFKPLLPPVLASVRKTLGRGNQLPGGGYSIINADFAERTKLAKRVEDVWRARRRIKTSQQYHCSDLTHGVMVHALESTNKLSAAFALEHRHPYFDKRLIEFCLALPREQKICDGWTRIIVRRALADVLPDKIIRHGSKWNPNEFFARRILSLEKDSVERVIFDDGVEIEPYIDLLAIREAYHRHIGHPTVDDAYTIWKAATLALWLRTSGVSV